MKKSKEIAWNRTIKGIRLLLCLMPILFHLQIMQVNAAETEPNVHYLTPYQTTAYDVYDNNQTESFTMMGIDYHQGALGQNTYSDKVVLYNLNKDFDSVSFKVGHLDGARTGNAELQIYTDGNLVETTQLSGDMLTQTVTIETKNIQQLKLVDTSSGNGRYGVADVIGTGGHIYESEVTKIATVKQSGTRTYTCKYCKHSYIETIEARVNCTAQLQPYQTTRANVYVNDEQTYFTVMGKRYYDGVVGIYNDSNSKEALYNLGQNYSEVTFTVGHLDGGSRGSTTLQVYTDGIHRKDIPLNGDMINETVVINTEGVTQLKIFLGSGLGRYAIFDINYVTDLTSQHLFKEKIDEAGGFITYICENCGAYYIEPIKKQEGNNPATNTGGSISSEKNDASLTLSKSKVTLYTGKVSKTVKITANVTGASRTVTWRSSNIKVAKVSSNGKITAVSKGTAEVTATANGIKKVVKVSVKDPAITVKKSGKAVKSVAVRKKKRVNLSVSVKPVKSGIRLIALTAKQKKIASVKLSGGKLIVTGKNSGKIKIKLKSGAATKTLTITVKK